MPSEEINFHFQGLEQLPRSPRVKRNFLVLKHSNGQMPFLLPPNTIMGGEKNIETQF